MYSLFRRDLQNNQDIFFFPKDSRAVECDIVKVASCVVRPFLSTDLFEGNCAIGSTVAHDSHHMIVVGTDEEQMALAANHLAEINGGQVVIIPEFDFIHNDGIVLIDDGNSAQFKQCFQCAAGV